MSHVTFYVKVSGPLAAGGITVSSYEENPTGEGDLAKAAGGEGAAAR